MSGMVAATIVDVSDLLQTVAASFVAGVGVTVVFSIAIYAIARFGEARRADAPIAAAGSALLAAVALTFTGLAIAASIYVMAFG